ncbi:wax ester/triacylglycerol synthase family O-acyltransferase [Rhizohabitans arisaemae]|uniref:WS/DGAT/MGAT family O-acyltransferase n=1 Tax=Rhizohabitans arisaemae TaxID=2720610 RepID=UPI0031FECAB4
MTALDAQFLNIETETNLAHMAVLAVLDPITTPSGTLTRTDLITLLRGRLHLAPPLRHRLVQVPFDLDYPYWIEDPDFDLENHVREIALPAYGGDRLLADQVAWLHGLPLDRSRPLWEMYLIHGLSAGRVALYCKMHHAVVDGVTGANILAAIVDLAPGSPPPPDPDPWQPEPVPSPVDTLVEGLTRSLKQPIRTLKTLGALLPDLDAIPLAGRIPGMRELADLSRTVRQIAVGTDRSVPELPPMPVPETPFNRPISAHRRFAFGTLPLDEVKKVKNAFGITVNDVVMALCASALRQWLGDQDAVPGEPLIAAVPVSTRQTAGDATPGNRLSAMLTPLPTHLADPVARLESVRDTMHLVKRRFATAPANWLADLAQLLPAAVTGVAMRTALRLAAAAVPPVNLIVSNVAGPQVPLYIGGARVLAHYPVSVISDVTGGLNITVFSGEDRVDVGVVACRESTPELWSLVRYLGDALEELKRIGGLTGERPSAL